MKSSVFVVHFSLFRAQHVKYWLWLAFPPTDVLCIFLHSSWHACQNALIWLTTLCHVRQFTVHATGLWDPWGPLNQWCEGWKSAACWYIDAPSQCNHSQWFTGYRPNLVDGLQQVTSWWTTVQVWTQMLLYHLNRGTPTGDLCCKPILGKCVKSICLSIYLYIYISICLSVCLWNVGRRWSVS